MTLAKPPNNRGDTAMLQIGMGWFAEEPGGLNRMYAGLLAGLVARDVAVTGLVAGRAPAPALAPPHVRFFAPREANIVSRLRACRRAANAILSDQTVGVVGAHFSPYALPILDLIKDRPFVFHFHGPWAAESATERQPRFAVHAKRAIEKAVYRRAQRFIVLSEAFADLLVRDYGVRRAGIEIVPGGVDSARFAIDLSQREARRALGLPTDRAIVGVVRRLVHRMGLENLIDALAEVREHVPDVLLAIAGSGPLAASLVARVAARRLEGHVVFLGFVADDKLPLFYRGCDLSVVPSVALEGFGLTTIESLAAGTPVLVTPVGGLPETVRGLDPGLVLPDAQAATVAAALTEVLKGRRPVPSRERCEAYARETFDWHAIAERTLRVYERA